uniref:Uncharacterized protein n=1 Tax=Glossina austeni TaxID=7395 RepID=A0A1A9UTU5_GLOAU
MLRLRFKPLTKRLRIPQIMWTAFQHDYMEPRRRSLEMQRYSNIVRTIRSPKVQQEFLKSSESPVGIEEETLNWLQRMFKFFEMTGQKFPIVNVNLRHSYQRHLNRDLNGEKIIIMLVCMSLPVTELILSFPLDVFWNNVEHEPKDSPYVSHSKEE